MSDRRAVTTDGAPAPRHAFGQGVIQGGLLQVSGQGPADPATGEWIGIGDIHVQTRRTLENVRAVLQAGGAEVGDVLMFRVYLARRSDFTAMSDAYGAFIAEHVRGGVLPSRTTVVVGLPDEAMLVEIDALAVVPGLEPARR